MIRATLWRVSLARVTGVCHCTWPESAGQKNVQLQHSLFIFPTLLIRMVMNPAYSVPLPAALLETALQTP